MKKIIVTLLLIMGINSCTSKEDSFCCDSQFSKSFIQVFVIADEENTGCKYYAENDAIWLIIGGETVAANGYLGNYLGNTNYGRPAQELLNYYCEQFGDTCYNSGVLRFENCAVVDVFFIDVTCNKDFNDYPAGSSLKEIIEFIGSSLFEFIESGYTKNFDWLSNVPSDIEKYPSIRKNGYHPIIKKLSEIEHSDMKLLDPISYLRFTEMPLPGDYIFTINFKSSDKEIVKNVNIRFF